MRNSKKNFTTVKGERIYGSKNKYFTANIIYSAVM